MKNLKPWQWAMGINGLLLVGGMALIIFPAQRNRRALVDDMADKQMAIGLLSRTAQSGQNILTTNARLEQTLAGFDTRLSAADPGGAMSDLWRLIEANSLHAGSMRITGEQKSGAYVAKEVTVTLSGRFSDFYSLLAKLPQEKPVWRVTHLHLARTTNANDEIAAELTIRAWMQAPQRSVALTD